MKHRITLTDEEIAALEDRLAVIAPMEYDLHTLSLLRGLYGRFGRMRMEAEMKAERDRLFG